MTPAKEEITAFWNWFASVSDHLEHLIVHSASTEVSDLLDSRVRSLSAAIGWEVGPGTTKLCALSFGLRHDLNNLTATQTIVAAAPCLPHWEFFAARPPKSWDLRFVLMDPSGRPFEVDARSWKYSLTSFGGNEFFDVIVVASDLPPSRGLLDQAASIVLLGVLGEIDFLRRIDRITVVRSVIELDSRQAEGLTEMERMREHLLMLAGGLNGT